MCEAVRYGGPEDNMVPAASWAAQDDVPADRLQLARELHDVVASGLATISLQASLAERVLTENPARALVALADIRRLSRVALDELQAILGILRTPQSHVAEHSPGAPQIAALASATTKAGIATNLTIVGERGLLPAEVSLAAYRIVQESLTNVLRHSQAASATVRLTYEAERLLVEVEDAGIGTEASISGHSHGILGMQERAAALGGELEASARAQGGFRVRATLPFGGGG
jgi:YD repeat-containing protein